MHIIYSHMFLVYLSSRLNRSIFWIKVIFVLSLSHQDIEPIIGGSMGVNGQIHNISFSPIEKAKES